MSDGEVNQIDRQARYEKVSRAEYIRGVMRRAVRTPTEKRMEETLGAATDRLTKANETIGEIEWACRRAGSISDRDREFLFLAWEDMLDAFCEAREAALACMAPNAWARR